MNLTPKCSYLYGFVEYNFSIFGAGCSNSKIMAVTFQLLRKNYFIPFDAAAINGDNLCFLCE